jgi:hypothetical protein
VPTMMGFPSFNKIERRIRKKRELLSTCLEMVVHSVASSVSRLVFVFAV